MSLRLVMMGTGRFGLPTLRGLYETDHKVVGLFTQPDPSGPGRHRRHRNPMKEAAQAHGTAVFQPANVNTPEALDDLRTLQPDVCVVAAYGQILSKELLEIPRLGAVNVHASLLPKYRGAAPVAYAILNGESETGVTLFQIDPRLDAGPILGVEKTAVGPKETAGELEARLADIAVPLTIRVIDQLEEGTTQPVPQDPDQVTRAPRLEKADGQIDWSQSAEAVERHIRAMQPWPKAFTWLKQAGQTPLRLIVLDVEPADDLNDQGDPGAVVSADDHRLTVATSGGFLEIRRLQPEGKQAMTADEFLRGHPVQPGDRMTGNLE